MVSELGCSTFAATVGLSVYPLGFGLVPLFTSSLSEEFGRFPIYIVTTFLFALMHVMTALQVVPRTILRGYAYPHCRAPNITTVIVGRFLSGSFGSTGATLVGGTIADVWKPDE